MNLNEAKIELGKLAEILAQNPNTKIVKISDTTIKEFRHFSTGWDYACTYYVDVDQCIKAGIGQDEYTYMIKERST